MDSKKYWEGKHLEWITKDWIDKPTIFAQFALKYFPKKGKLLELGAGQGQDSRFFARKGYGVTATDFSDNALRLLEEKIIKEKVNIKIEKVDLSNNLPHKGNSFDVVYSHLALHYFDSKITRHIFEEINRILKKGGVLAALFNSMDDPEVKEFEKLEEGFYMSSSGITKRYFTVDSAKTFIQGIFDPIVLDSHGENYKDKINTLIRFIGKKV